MGLHNHRRFGFVLLLAKQRIFGHYQMYAHRFHFAHAFERALQFTFERALIIDLFGKVGSRPVRCVEDFKSWRAPRGRPCAAVFTRALSN